uniref:Uncharacterized protein n=1 Tax=Clytia hemisphaerica TaxID=252671 RepID=A0A7M5WV99_9CNID
CLNGWTAIIGQPNCYFITDLQPLLKYQLQQYCQSIYGRVAVPHDFQAVTQFMRLILKNFVENRSHHQIEADIKEIIKNGDDFLARGFPLCERPKTEVTGRYPWTKWPKGTYGLPMSRTGCPVQNHFEWRAGSYVQNTENDSNANEASHDLHLHGNVNKGNITSHYCIKTDPVGNTSWPDGRYCIYRKGGKCPDNMVSSAIFWDDEDTNNRNKADGVHPDGMFKADTIIQFCCMDRPLNKKGIVLPRDQPFHLFPFKGPQCQHVIGTKSRLEYVQYDLENDDEWVAGETAFEEPSAYGEITKDKKHLKLYHCYYEPIPSCGVPTFGSNSIDYNQSEFNVGHKLNYACPRGFSNAGDSNDVCLVEEMWSSLEGANCEDINECVSKNQVTRHQCHRKANCYNTPGSYRCKCNPGWQGNGRNCYFTNCTRPKPIANGELRFSSDSRTFLLNDQVSLKCYPEYLLIGNNVSVCQGEGTWSQLGSCQCKSPLQLTILGYSRNSLYPLC